VIEEYRKVRFRSRKIIRAILIFGITIMTFLLVLRIIPEVSRRILFPIKKVEILGLDCITREDVLRILELDTGTSLLLCNRKKIEKLLQQDPRIKNVELLKVYPDRLKIYIQEKEKSILIQTGSEMFWVSIDGVVLEPSEKPLDKIEVKNPFITLNNNYDDIKNGERIENLLVRELIQTLGIVEQRFPVFYKLIYNVVLDDKGISLYFLDSLKPGMVVYLGYEVNIDKFDKLRALVLVLQETWREKDKSSKLLQIDMSFSYAVVNEME